MSLRWHNEKGWIKNEQKKYEVIKELVNHSGNKNRASKKLGIFRRQVNRLIIKYNEKIWLCSGNRGHIPSKALDKSISENIILLYMNKYYDFNFNHFKNFKKRKGPIISNIEILIKWDFSGIEVKKF